MAAEFQVVGKSTKALFTLKLHRGEGMCLIAMNWKKGPPPDDFVGFAIEYKEPGGDKYFPLKNRLNFLNPDGTVNPTAQSTKVAPIQMFRWVHFPRNAELDGPFTYRVSPVFMNDRDELSYGEPQEAEIELRRETYPGVLNVAFTRGFVSSQGFVDKFVTPTDGVQTLLPAKADKGLDYIPSHPKAEAALAWMGFEARSAILELLDQALADETAKVSVIAYDLNEPDIVAKLVTLAEQGRLRIVIDDDGAHGKPTSAEAQAAKRLAKACKGCARRQHMGKLQHNKMVVVNGDKVKAAVGGSTNFSWRGFFVQNNNALVLRSKAAVDIFQAAFEAYWENDANDIKLFGGTGSAVWNDLKLPGIDADVGFSPRSTKNAVLEAIAKDMRENTTSSLFFSLAFLYQTKGPIRSAVAKLSDDDAVFCYGISDHEVKLASGKEASGIKVQKPSGKVVLVRPEVLSKGVPPPFKSEPTGGGGTRMHHKFVVIDFDKPTARVYVGSYNFSDAADTKNGENLFAIRDRRVAVAYTVEALRIFDHYHFRVAQLEARKAKEPLHLLKPPPRPGPKPWFAENYSIARKIQDRELFA